MAYVTPTVRSVGDAVTAADYNIMANDVLSFRDNTGVVPPACRVRRTATGQSLGNGVVAALNFDTEDFDTNAMFAPTANFITIKTAGIYIVTATVVLTANATGNRALIIYLNPTVTGAGDSATLSAGTEIANSTHTVGVSTTSSTCASTIYNFALNDVVCVGFFQNSGIALATSGSSQLSAAMFGATT